MAIKHHLGMTSIIRCIILHNHFGNKHKRTKPAWKRACSLVCLNPIMASILVSATCQAVETAPNGPSAGRPPAQSVSASLQGAPGYRPLRRDLDRQKWPKRRPSPQSWVPANSNTVQIRWMGIPMPACRCIGMHQLQC
jgi:hypothetical protein